MDAASVTSGSYAAAGINPGPAMTFGSVTACEITEQSKKIRVSQT